MKNLKKSLALIAALALSATALCSCGDDNKSSSSTASTPDSSASTPADSSAATPAGSDDDALTILCWGADDAQPMVDLFCSETGTDASKIRLQNFACQGGEAAEKYDAYLKDAAADADIMFVEADWALRFINDDSVTAPLSDIGISEDSFSDIYDYVLEIGKATEGSKALKGISWQAAAGGYCYREDLAKSLLGVENPDQMQEKVADWDKFMETAKTVKEKSGDDKTALAATLGGVWQVYSGSRGSAWVDESGKLAADDYCTKYMDFAKSLWDNGYVTNVSQWADEWKPLGQTNKVMGYFVSTWGFGDTILEGAAGGPDGETFGKWKCIVGPQEFYWGGTWMAPTTRCNNPDLAKQFIEFFTSNKDTAKKYAISKGEYMSNKAVMEDIITNKEYAGAPVLGGQNQFEVLNKVADGIDMAGKITPYDATIKADFSSAVTGYCNGDTEDVTAAMEDFKDRVSADCPDVTVD